MTANVILAALLGILLPSSLGGQLQPRLGLGLCAVAVLLFINTMRAGRWLGANGWLALAVLALFAIATATSPLPELALGGLAPYLLFLTALMVDTRGMTAHRAAVAALLVCNVVVLMLGLGTVLDLSFLQGVTESLYKDFDEELYISMIIWSAKPVSVFASHSISAFCYFALCLLNFRLSRWQQLSWASRLAFRVCCFAFLALLPLLVSNTALALFAPAVLWLGWQLLDRWQPWLRVVGLAAMTLMVGVSTLAWLGMSAGDVMALVSVVTSEEGSGLLGRYVPGGRLQPTYNYLMLYPFRPVGLTMSPNLALGDSFITEYVTRISVLGYAMVLLMLWRWLKHNLDEPTHRIAFFTFFLLADVGYPLLPYPRVAAALPLFVLLWRASGKGTSPVRVPDYFNRQSIRHPV
jgi:hypothetical protein